MDRFCNGFPLGYLQDTVKEHVGNHASVMDLARSLRGKSSFAKREEAARNDVTPPRPSQSSKGPKKQRRSADQPSKRPPAQQDNKPTSSAPATLLCHSCGKSGHYARECAMTKRINALEAMMQPTLVDIVSSYSIVLFPLRYIYYFHVSLHNRIFSFSSTLAKE